MSDTNRINIIRTRHDGDNKFFVMSRASAQDKSLSWEARGVLAYLLSQRNDWTVMIADLKQNCGRDKVYKILNELIKAGYLKREDKRDNKGRVTEVFYRVFEVPSLCEPLPENPETANQETDYPLTEKPDTDLPDTDNPPLINTELELNTELPISKEEKPKHAPKGADVPKTPEIKVVSNASFELPPRFKSMKLEKLMHIWESEKSDLEALRKALGVNDFVPVQNEPDTAIRDYIALYADLRRANICQDRYSLLMTKTKEKYAWKKNKVIQCSDVRATIPEFLSEYQPTPVEPTSTEPDPLANVKPILWGQKKTA